MEHESKSLADYLALLKRRKTALIVTIMAVTLVGVVIAYSIPAMYRSTARFLIEQQNIPQDIVQSTITSYVDEQIQEVRQRTMASGNMLQLIQKYDLYPELNNTGQSQTAIEELRLNALLETEVFEVMNPRSGRAMLATISFSLSFDYTDPLTAKDVASDIANLYISENVRSRTGQVQETLEFILSDIERYTQEVDRTGALLAEFKERNMGNLPELMNHNLQTIERTERQIDGLDREIRDARNRQLQFGSDLARLGPATTVYDETGTPILNPIEQLGALQREKMRLISIYSSEHPDVIQIQKEIDILSFATAGDGSYLANLEAQLGEARLVLAQNQQRYSADHPDVVRSKRSVDNLTVELAQAREDNRPYASGAAVGDPYAEQLRIRMEAEESNIRSLTRRKTELAAKLADLETKVALSPRIEQEYETFSRNNQAAIDKLNETRTKFEDAQKAEKLESEGSGDRFTIVEPANLPLEPFKPNRTAIILLAFVLATGMGVILATILDTMDDSIKNSRDVLQLINTPPLAVIPYMETSAEHAARIRSNIYLVGLMAGGVAAAILIANLLG